MRKLFILLGLIAIGCGQSSENSSIPASCDVPSSDSKVDFYRVEMETWIKRYEEVTEHLGQCKVDLITLADESNYEIIRKEQVCRLPER